MSDYKLTKLERPYHAMIYDCDTCEVRLIEFEPDKASMFPSEVECPGCHQMIPASYKIKYTHSVFLLPPKKKEAGRP